MDKNTKREIGDTVGIRHAPDIEATVTGILHRAGGHIEYELTWMVTGEIKTAWLTPMLLEDKEKGKTVGFEALKG